MLEIVEEEREVHNHIKFQVIAGKIIRRSLKCAQSLASLNFDSLYSALLNSWFLKYKSLKPPASIVQDSEQVVHFETKLFNSVRQANIQSQNAKTMKQVTLEVKLLRDDLRKLFGLLSSNDQAEG